MVLSMVLSDIASAENAWRAGVTSIELCTDKTQGGITPSIGLIEECVRRFGLQLHVNVLIRPRAGDFIYSDSEMEIIYMDILAAKAAGVDGIVIGILKRTQTKPSGYSTLCIDIDRMRVCISLARPMSVTFHRAFDEVLNPINVLHQLIKLRADRILTSGQKKTAIDGIELIKKLINISNNNIKIMPGSGINSTNILEINKLNINEIHGSFTGSSKNNKKLSNFDEISSCIELMKSD